MIDKAVRDSLESVVESVAVYVTAPDAAEALTTADAVVTGRIAYTPVSYTHLTLPTIYSV